MGGFGKLYRSKQTYHTISKCSRRSELAHIFERKEAKRTTIINQLNEGVSVENVAESQGITVDEVIAIKNEIDQKETESESET